jgi:hypothetical protein
MNTMFSRYGIPGNVVSDNGPQFSSREFRKFAVEWSFDHVKYSLRYPQSNRKTLNAVRTCQMLMKKAAEGQNDFYIVLIDWRNTPNAVGGLSPVQSPYGGRIRPLMPTRETSYHDEIL